MINYETNSKLILPGQIYVAIKGHTVDGHDFIKEAIMRGASKIVGEQDLSLDVPYEKVASSEEYLKEHLVNEYKDKIKNLKIIGVTGTNGKTTSCYLVYQMLQKLGKKACYLGTIGYYADDYYEEALNTTPDILNLYKFLLKAINDNREYFVMEISSHALEQERIKGLKLCMAGFTNLTEDHLDFHQTMDNYLKAKLKIIDYLNNDGYIITNIDDAYGAYFQKPTFSKTYGIHGDYQIMSYDIKPYQTKIKFQYDNQIYDVTTNLTCEFNVYNYMNALAIVNSLGFNIFDIIKITKDIYPPKGRCETYEYHNNYIVIDYAHTPDAVEKVIKAYQNVKHNHIFTIIGCGGNREPLKRPLMGNLATTLSDYVIFTNDNPRLEDEKKIMNDITKELSLNNYEIIYKREEAIQKGISLLQDNDILLILGKGHENYQIIGHTKYHLDDAEVIKKIIGY